MKDKSANLTSRDTVVTEQIRHNNESGFALVAALIILIILGIISVTVLAFATAETRTASNDLNKTQTFYAAEAKSEDMSFQFNNLFQSSVAPSGTALNGIANITTPEIDFLFTGQGYSFTGSSLSIDPEATATFNSLFGGGQPFLRIPDGPYFGMSASVAPYISKAKATHLATGTRVEIDRKFNSYLIPIFQFSIFSDGDVELDPAVSMVVSGRVHANGNIYAMRNLLFTGNITTAGELVRDVKRSGVANSSTGNNLVDMKIASPASTCPSLPVGTPKACQVRMGAYPSGAFYGSVNLGPNFLSAALGQRGYWPGSPDGAASSTMIGAPPKSWDVASLRIPLTNNTNLDAGHFGNQLLTKSNYQIDPLKLPLGVQDVTPVELIKRSVPNVDNTTISEARYDNKAQIRILIDDDTVSDANSKASIPLGKGVDLSTFDPMPLCSSPCNPLRRIDVNGNWFDATTGKVPIQRNTPTEITPNIPANEAPTVRGIKSVAGPAPTGSTRIIPPGAGIRGRILIEVVPACSAPCTPGTAIDVTREILSMGMTIGEPNGIVRLQEPLWAAFMQHDRGYTQANSLYDRQKETAANGWENDGEITTLAAGNFDTTYGFINRALNSDKEHTTGAPPLENTRPFRDAKPPAVPFSTSGSITFPVDLNAIVPINLYNVREGWINQTQNPFYVYKRGITSVVDLDMYNLVRWLDGKFDGNLLAGSSTAQGANIHADRGYVIYVSDRRGDSIKNETINPSLLKPPVDTTNGNVDNEDVYWDPTGTVLPNGINGGTPDVGEDVIADSVFIGSGGTLQKDGVELPDSLVQPSTSPAWDFKVGVGNPPTPALTLAQRIQRAILVASWKNDNSTQLLTTAMPNNQLGAPEIYFRRSVRLSFGENLATACSYSDAGSPTVRTWGCPLVSSLPGDAGKLSPTKGITVASENMVYIAGNYNTQGLGGFVSGGANLNNNRLIDGYLGPQVPASIVTDAFFPLSKIWFDGEGAMFPEGTSLGNTGDGTFYRIADRTASPGLETAVRAAIMFGTTQSALKANPGFPARTTSGTISSGGFHNAPRFLEQWSVGVTSYKWSMTGSMVTLFNSTQAFAPWENTWSVTYTPPARNWSYDNTFTDPNRLPPGTPYFQYVQSSGFQQVIENK